MAIDEATITLRIKINLLKHLLDKKKTFSSPDIGDFWQTIGETFLETKHHGDAWEEFCDNEVAKWAEERSNPGKKRRIAHDAGGQYDQLMTEWVEVWDSMLLDHWEWELTKEGPQCGNFLIIPESFRASVKQRIQNKGGVKALAKRASAKNAIQKKMEREMKPRRTFEYDGDKLKRVVDAAKERAVEVGKPDLAAAVNQIYEDALSDFKLRILLEAILTQEATSIQNNQFQEYVKIAKKKLKERKARATRKFSPQVQLNGKNDTTADGQNSDRAVSDSAYASEQKDDRDDKDKVALIDNDSSNGTKRRRDSQTSLMEAEEEDLAEAKRASKRRRRADSDASYHPNDKAAAARRRNGTLDGTATSRESSPLSEAADVDIEAAKEAYVDEMVHRKSAEASRRAIEDEFGPVSPTASSWKSMKSPTMYPAVIASNTTDQQANSGAEKIASETPAPANNSTKSPPLNVPPRIVPPPPPPPPPPFPVQPLLPAEGEHAYRIITGATAEVVNPALTQLADKIDMLIANQKSQPLLGAPLAANEAAASSSQELSNLTNILQSGSLDLRNPEFLQIISDLTQKAAQASIHAAEAARHAGIVARDVSQVLAHIAAQNTQKPADKPPSKSRGKK